MENELDGKNTVRTLLVRLPLRIPLHPLLLRDDPCRKHARPHVQQNEPGKPVLQGRGETKSHIGHKRVRRVDHHLTEVVGTADILEHAVGDQSLLELKRVVLLRIYDSTISPFLPETIMIATPSV